MSIPTPFHERTQPLCISYRWKDWAGYYAVCRYDSNLDREYFAFRHAAGLIDVTPLFKYDVQGPDAAALLSRMMVRDIRTLKVGRVAYCCWCDDRGKVVDDGTVSRLDEDYYRVTAAEPTQRWLQRIGRSYRATVQDSSRRIAVVALQGPTSRDILRRLVDFDIDQLKFFGAAPGKVGMLKAIVSRTGYTGDLGYEIWVENRDAIRLWDTLIGEGADFGITPAGLDALDMTRIEAGFIMLSVDYDSATKVTLPTRKSNPYEIGLGWTVQLDRDPFVGQQALRAAKQQDNGSRLVGLELSWQDLESLYSRYGLPTHLAPGASREPLPVYHKRGQVGKATSHMWSPTLKKAIALASVEAGRAEPGTSLEVEHTVEFVRHRVPALVVKTPFFDPERKKKP